MSAFLALSIFPVCLAIAAAYDLTTMSIPNWISLVLVAGFCALALPAGLAVVDLAVHLGVGAAALLVGFALFAAGFIGGGDAKLLAAISVWVGWASYAPYLFAAVVTGGVLALAVLLARQFPLPPVLARRSWIVKLHQPGNGIPYGLALAAGGIAVFPETDLYRLLAA